METTPFNHIKYLELESTQAMLDRSDGSDGSDAPDERNRGNPFMP